MLPLYLLMLLERGPHHGTEMIKNIGEMSQGAWAPSPGSVYPVLKRFEKEGLVTGRWQRGQAAPKRVYTLTRRGREAVPKLQSKLFEELEGARQIIDQHLLALEAMLGSGGGHGHG